MDRGQVHEARNYTLTLKTVGPTKHVSVDQMENPAVKTTNSIAASSESYIVPCSAVARKKMSDASHHKTFEPVANMRFASSKM